MSLAPDFGASSGRWISQLISNFCLIYAIEPSDGASKALTKKFVNEKRVRILQETVGMNLTSSNSLDLAISLGVLHLIPDTALAIKDVGSKIRSGRVYLCYLYYRGLF